MIGFPQKADDGESTPYGAEEVREVIFRRKREEMERVREERARREAYTELDRKIFEEELKASLAAKVAPIPVRLTRLGLQHVSKSEMPSHLSLTAKRRQRAKLRALLHPRIPEIQRNQRLARCPS